MHDGVAQVACTLEQEKDAVSYHNSLHSLTRFTLKDMAECGVVLCLLLGEGAFGLEDLATRITRHLYESLRGSGTETKHCALARLFVMRGYNELEPNTRPSADRVLKGKPDPDTKCLMGYL